MFVCLSAPLESELRGPYPGPGRREIAVALFTRPSRIRTQARLCSRLWFAWGEEGGGRRRLLEWGRWRGMGAVVRSQSTEIPAEAARAHAAEGGGGEARPPPACVCCCGSTGALPLGGRRGRRWGPRRHRQVCPRLPPALLPDRRSPARRALAGGSPRSGICLSQRTGHRASEHLKPNSCFQTLSVFTAVCRRALCLTQNLSISPRGAPRALTPGPAPPHAGAPGASPPVSSGQTRVDVSCRGSGLLGLASFAQHVLRAHPRRGTCHSPSPRGETPLVCPPWGALGPREYRPFFLVMRGEPICPVTTRGALRRPRPLPVRSGRRAVGCRFSDP